MPRVRQVTIRRFKRLENITFDLGNATLLVGANNSGKSSVLQAIHFAVSIAQTARLVGEGVSWAADNFELSFNPAQLIYSPVADVMSLASGGVLQEPRTARIEIQFHAGNGDQCVVGLRRGRNRNIAVQITGRALGEALMDITHPFTVYAPGLAGIPKEERYMSPGVIRRVVARGDANLVLRNVLLMLSRDATRWQEFLQDISTLFPQLTLRVDFDEETDENVSAFFRLGAGPELPVDAAGTSILQASQILAYVGVFQPRLLILDEPDSHLHPDNQRALCRLVYRLAEERNFQVMIGTHSRHVLDAMRGLASVLWLSKGSLIEGEDANTTSVLLDLGALDSVDYFADGMLRCLVATEDANTDLIKALLWSNGFVEAETEMASYSGSSKVEAALVLGGFLRARAPNLTLVVHRDRDYLPDPRAQAFEQNLTAAGFVPFLTLPSDIEGYFLNPQHLSALNAGLSVERAAELIAVATAETRDASVAAIVTARTQEAFRLRAAGVGPPDHGQIAVDAGHDFDAAPATMRRGKAVMGRLVALLQQEIGATPRVFEPSVHLAVPELQTIAARIWAQVPAPAAL